MRLDAVLHGERGAVGDALQLGRALLAFEMGVAAGVELDDRRAEADRGFDLRLRRLDEQADPDVRRAELVDIISQVIVLAGGVEAALGRPLLALFGNDAGGVRAVRAARSPASPRSPPSRGSAAGRSRPSAGRCRWSVMCRRSSRRCAVMPSAPAFGGEDRGANRVGMIAAARVPDGRDVIDVDAQPGIGAACRSRGRAAPGLDGRDRLELRRKGVRLVGRDVDADQRRCRARRDRRCRPSGRRSTPRR